MAATVAEALAVAAEFAFGGPIVSTAPYGSGHINDTFLTPVGTADGPRRFILQRVNHQVFRQPDLLMENVARVCAHAHAKLRAAGAPDARRRALRLVPTKGGQAWHVDPSGNRWRCYDFIEGATGHDVVRSPAQAEAAAKAFGAFQSLLADLPGDRLHETIPDFHHTPARFARFQAALAKDGHGRAAAAGPEIAFALARGHEVGVIVDALRAGTLPERVTHNDTKLNNVLLDDVTQEGVCVIDLDTVMPGSALYDFGDLVRTSTSPAAEDETDLSRVRLQLPMFEALVRGYLASARGFLTPREKELLPFAGKLITFEIGLRFLTDWLEGDAYFKIKRPAHNLDRCRTQFALVASIEGQFPAMQEIVARA
ncbi:MAG: aminoglycoside phosphotransferase family protein [Verrucomicrobia bacterium]|nr:aminoglycoside phosphotransferase family protein [Verrucomicrobiota bacterium]